MIPMPDRMTAKTFPIVTEPDVIIARQMGRSLASRLGFSVIDQARITTAISELARNIINYGVRGSVTICGIKGERGEGIEIRFDDVGPGIPDVAKAMSHGYSSKSGLGVGLPGSRRLMDDFDLRTAPGEGVHIVVRKWL